MKIKNLKYFILSSFLSLTILSCEDSVDKVDYQNDDPLGSTTLATYEAVEIGANYAVIEGINNGGVSHEIAIVLADNDDLFGAKRYHVESEKAFSIRAVGLVPNTTYYYASLDSDSLRINAKGEVKSFTTEDGVIAFSIDNASASQNAWNSAGFSVIDKDGDGFNWELIAFPSGSTTYAFRSQSWAGSPLTPENYLVFPPIEYKGTDGSMAFEIRATNPDWYAETVKLVISDESITEDNCRDAEELFSHTLASGASYFANVDVPSEYNGKTIYFALVHTDVSDMDAIVFLGATFIYK